MPFGGVKGSGMGRFGGKGRHRRVHRPALDHGTCQGAVMCVTKAAAVLTDPRPRALRLSQADPTAASSTTALPLLAVLRGSCSSTLISLRVISTAPK